MRKGKQKLDTGTRVGWLWWWWSIGKSKKTVLNSKLTIVTSNGLKIVNKSKSKVYTSYTYLFQPKRGKVPKSDANIQTEATIHFMEDLLI